MGVYLRQLPSQKSDHASIGEEDADAPDEWLDPRPEYTRPLGAPLGDGVRGPDGVWRRSFSSGTNVSFANTTGGGPMSTIAWADGHTQHGFPTNQTEATVADGKKAGQ